jgi:formamidopyrimidine-DNA glycosylase
MPELAEVEFYRRRWWEAAAQKIMRAAQAQPRSRVFRQLDAEFPGGALALARDLAGARLCDSGTHGKQMWFVFKVGTPFQGVRLADATRTDKLNVVGALSESSGRLGEASLPISSPISPHCSYLWLGIHLGLTGELRVESTEYAAQKHDALVLRWAKGALVFNDARQFGRVRAWAGAKNERPPWLRELPPEVTSATFTLARVRECLTRHARAPLKAVLLDQEYFPGVGNWMADEILWRAALHPALPAGRAANLKTAKILHATIKKVAHDALRVVAGAGKKLPPDLNVHIPDTWLFNHRWENGGLCPKTKKLLQRAEIGGRTTCWSPARQKLPGN